MTWYAAHLLFYVKLKGKRQTRYPLWENIVLVKANSDDEAFAKAEKRARDDACMVPDDSFTWGGEPAEWVFSGVRKLTLCTDEYRRPSDGTEISYLQLEAPSWQVVQKLIRGEPVTVKIDDQFTEEPPAKKADSSKDGRRSRVV